MVALTTRDNAKAIALALLEMKLPRELDRGFCRLRPAGGEVNASTIAEIRRRKCQEPSGELFRRLRMKLRGVRECDLRRLLGHRSPDFGDAMADADDRGLSGGVQQAPPVGGVDPAAFAANGDGEGLAQISGKERGRRRHFFFPNCSRTPATAIVVKAEETQTCQRWKIA